VARITVKMAQAWVDGTKLTVSALDLDLLDLLESEILGRLNSAFDTSVWTDETTTPKLIQAIITKMYIAWVYDRAYSEDIEQGSNYADRLKQNAEGLIVGLLDGTIELPGVEDIAGSPVFYPTDASSALVPTFDDPSLGPAQFSMGMMF
jgi:hypothetical protein